MSDTRIIGTLGPSSSDVKSILALHQAGLSVARINLSHGTREDHVSLLSHIKSLQSEGNLIASLFDTRGCEIRTGDTEKPISVSVGQEILFCSTAVQDPPENSIQVGYDGFAEDVSETDRILVDNGELEFEIIEIREDGSVLGQSRSSGEITSRRHINLPGADIDLPSITDKDWADIEYAALNGVDYIALSFVRSPEDVESVRSLIQEKGSKMQIVSKIENQQALERLDGIIEASDAVMVARGDLGAEIDFTELPRIQDDIVERCHTSKTPVIVATHMLESMKTKSIPSRAEMTDVAHASETYADATMLSAETAVGKHPARAVSTMSDLLRATEDDLPLKEQILLKDTTYEEVLQISKSHSNAPIIVESSDVRFLLSLSLLYGVNPKLV